MADGDLDGRIAEARRILMRLPGVVAVGYGYKERRGQTTREVSLQVFVREKKAPADLPDDQLIPAQLLGLRTDVQTVPRVERADCRSTASYSSLEGGIHISNLKAFLDSGGDLAFGTLGFLGTINNSTSKDRIVLLSNHHVLTADGAGAGATIYQPFVTYPATGPAELQADRLHPIGSIHHVGFEENKEYRYDGDPPEAAPPDGYWLDCATAKVDTCFSSWCDSNCGVGFTIVVHGLQVGSPASDVIEGIARLRPSDLVEGEDYTVVKVGQRTGRTVGKVIGVLVPSHLADTGEATNNVIRVENTGPNCEPGAIFADQGDSGSVLVNADRKIVGLLYARGDAGLTGYACHIHPVLHWLGITLLARGATAGATGAGTLARAQLDESAAGEAAARAAHLREQILRSERGQVYRTLLERHREEVVHLVNRSRPVTVAWHRLHGPEFLSHMLQASRHADHSVPRQIAGLSRDAAFERFLAALERNGTPALRDAIDAHRVQLRALIGAADDLGSLDHRLREGTPAEHPEPVP